MRGRVRGLFLKDINKNRHIQLLLRIPPVLKITKLNSDILSVKADGIKCIPLKTFKVYCNFKQNKAMNIVFGNILRYSKYNIK